MYTQLVCVVDSLKSLRKSLTKSPYRFNNAFRTYLERSPSFEYCLNSVLLFLVIPHIRISHQCKNKEKKWGGGL